MAKQQKNALNRYSGRLIPSEAAAGMNAAISNARRLAEDAQLLLDAKRFPTATSLAILSLEESGKVSVLRGVLCGGQSALAANWKRYRSHSEKNFLGLVPDFVRRGARFLEDLRPLMTEATANDRGDLDSVKQLGFYTDCLGKGHWSTPTDAISEELATSLVRKAIAMVPKKTVTSRELELWVEHMRPWPAPLAEMSAKLATWARAMTREGLMTEQEAEGFIRFSTIEPRKVRSN